MTSMLTRFLLLLPLLLVLAAPLSAQSSVATTTIATMRTVSGFVEVRQKSTQKSVSGRNGRLLGLGDVIKTGTGAKATIVFRDGSRVRLFAETEFTIESGGEQKTKARTFKLGLGLKKGTLHGRLKRQFQQVSIRTPTAVVAVRGTVLLVKQSGELTTVHLTEGKIEVSNAASTVELSPGQWLPEFRRMDDLAEKRAPLPYKLFLRTEQYEVDLFAKKPLRLFLSIELGNSRNRRSLARPGPVLLESNFAGVVLPQRVNLNESGSVRVPFTLKPLPRGAQPFDGLILITAMMDAPGFEDVGAGTLLLKSTPTGKPQRFLIDPRTDAIRPKE